jgi:hypothetical protein
LAEATRKNNVKMADLVKGFDNYKVVQASSQRDTQKLLMDTNARLERLMELMVARPANTTEPNNPDHRIPNRPRVSLEAPQIVPAIIPAATTMMPATTAATNTSYETVDEEKRSGKRLKDRHSPKKQMAPVPVSEAHLEDTTMETTKQTIEKVASPSLLPWIMTAAANSMSAVLEPASLIKLPEIPVPVLGLAKDDKANNSFDTVFDKTPPTKETEESMATSLSGMANESIEEVFTDDPNILAH